MKKARLAVWAMVLSLVLCAAPVFAGAKAAIFVVIDRGITTSMNDGEVRNLNQVGEWMESDLVNVLKKGGFDAQLIGNKSEFKAAEGSYLLTVKITEYNPGSKAARIVVGWGAGAVSMKTHYELFGTGTSPILSDDNGVGSSRDWRNVIRKIDEQTTAAVKKKLL